MIIARLSLEYWLLEIADRLGNSGFVTFSVILSALLCFLWIPKSTDVMVNASAGLAARYLGRAQRTLVINISTNNPELFSMLVAFLMLRLGGVANPLGSNFANIYLMFGVALVFSLVAVEMRRGKAEAGRMLSLLWTERRLVVWHLVMSLFLFVAASVAYYLLVGVDQFGLLPGEPRVPAAWKLLLAAAVLLLAIAIFVLYDRRLKRRRPGLYLDIDETGHSASWRQFAIGTGGLILACWLMNALFLVWTDLYGTALAAVLGPAVFVALHFFVGALVTSLPEMTVAIKNFMRITTADLNTALAAASFSNMANLAIALLGSLIAAILLGLGLRLVL
jgi:hypothetical protein